MIHSRENGPTRSATRKALILGLMLATKPAHAQSTTFTVTNTNDSGQGSL